MKRSSWTQILANKISASQRLEEEIENYENGSEEKEKSAPAKTAARDAA
jgi:hypothetical protein